MTDTRDHLREEYTIDTPENVSFGYEVAGIGSRFIAALIDTFILGILLLLLNVALIMLLGALADSGGAFDLETNSNWIAGLVIALYALLNFAVIWGYYICFEWLNHGQTPGKQVARIRVVQLDGSPVGALPAVIRNLVRVVDFLPGGYGVGLIVMFTNSQSRRLGDFAAGTLVVRHQGEIRLADLLAPPTPSSQPGNLETSTVDARGDTDTSDTDTSDTYSTAVPLAGDDGPPIDQDWRGVRRLSSADYELVQQTLQRSEAGQLDPSLLTRVAGAIATKMGTLPSSYAKLAAQSNTEERTTEIDFTLARHFLQDLSTAYTRWVR